MRRFSYISFLLLTLSFLPLVAQAEHTQVMIRAMAVDAKFIGTSVGGVRVTIKDAETDELLDEGWVHGGTGDTDRLIKNPVQRGDMLADNNTAGYLATVDIDTPRLVKITLFGPYAYRQSLQEASVTTWLIPGKDLLGDGITIKMPGFIADGWTQVLQDGVVEFYLNASLMCGCPIKKNGLWNPDDYEAKAILMQDEKKIDEIPLSFTGPIGIFSAKTQLKKNGHYKAILYVVDTKTGNVGVDRTMFEINLD